ncbi:MAG TPA: YbaB/EbfC family nucleoid-associated protein [Gemmataceae bacterium]|nr:YbaB/EbfC family nucleoid-associated protein [Gemmataceae bacterium]
MFGSLGQIFSMLKNLPKMREEMGKLQQRLGQITAEGDAGGGMVKAKVNGQMEVLSCSISEEALRGGDKELLEDLIRSAVNAALHKVRAQIADETAKAAGGLGLPPGMSLPGMG